MNKKKMLTTGLAVALAVLLLIGGGTFAYLQSNSNDVKNSFKTNKVMVDLAESTGSDYDIIPGTTEKKDPTVTVDATVDAYVYVEVKDATGGLVDYAIADGWKALPGFDGVYYREVAKADAKQTFGVLKDDKVTYSEALENSDMLNADGTLKDGVELTFKAYAIQQKGFDDAVAAYKQVPAEAETAADVEEAVKAGKAVELTDDVTVKAQILGDENVNIDLNGKTMTVNGTYTEVADGESLVLENGTVNWVNQGTSPVAIQMKTGSTAKLKNITSDLGNNCILVTDGTEGANLDIIDSKLTTKCYYAVNTNAANNKTGKEVVINIKNSELTAHHSSNDDAAILFNIPGTLNIEGSTVTSDRQAVIVRCGTATIKDSKLVCTAADKNLWAKYDNAKWGSGNEVPVAALVAGNRSDAGAYPYDTTCTVSNTTFTLGDGNTGRTPVYAAAYNGHTTTISGVAESDITQSCGDDSTITIK